MRARPHNVMHLSCLLTYNVSCQCQFASVLLLSFLNAGIQFSFIPSPNITILQSAVYQCTVTGASQGDDVALRWNVNGVSSTSPSDWIPYTTSTGVTLVGTATESTLTIPGNTALNLTILVECIASGVANGEGYYNTSSDVLHIQGMLVQIF